MINKALEKPFSNLSLKLKILKKRFSNLPLKLKIMILIISILVLTAIASLISIRIVAVSNNRFLYKALAGSLSYSANDISAKLLNIEAMSSAIVSNKDIKKNLITLTDEDDDIKLFNARNTLDYLIFDYYQSNRTNCVNYINLYHDKNVTYSFEAQSQLVPDEVYDYIIKKTNRKSGYPCWITDYCNEYGLFLGRDCRRVLNMTYQSLGTLVINVDMDKLIRSSTESILYFPMTYYYVLYESGNSIYHSPGLDKAVAQKLYQTMDQDYKVIKFDNHKFFCIRGSYANFPWEYICLVPYDEISKALGISGIISVLIILLAIVISFLFSQKIIDSITVHFRRLLNKMDAFGNNDMVVLSSDYDYNDRNDEIGVLHKQFDSMVSKIQQLIKQNYVNEILARDARLKALEMQINPHFLYNTLDTLNWRAKAIGEKDMSSMVEALGSLLRVSLSQKGSETTLRHELEIVHHYITIQKIRFEEQLIYNESIDESLLDIILPQFTIQPLIENAIQYSREGALDACHVELIAKSHGDLAIIQVINSGSQFEEQILEKLNNQTTKPQGFGIALLNIHKRLQLIFGTEYGLTLYNRDENHAVAQITIPRRKLCGNC